MSMNEEKLHAFLGKAVGDLGAAISAVLVGLGDELGLYRALAKRSHVAQESWRSAPALTSVMCANGSPTRRPAATSNTMPPAASIT